MIPTVGFNMRKVTKGKVTIKLWDLGGQPRFRSMWERYCRGVHAIVYVVDSADPDNIAVSKTELHDLLAKPALERIPVLVLGNKNDLPEALSVDELIEKLNLKALTNREARPPPPSLPPGHRPRPPGDLRRRSAAKASGTPSADRCAATRSLPRTRSTWTSPSTGSSSTRAPPGVAGVAPPPLTPLRPHAPHPACPTSTRPVPPPHLPAHATEPLPATPRAAAPRDRGPHTPHMESTWTCYLSLLWMEIMTRHIVQTFHVLDC